MTQFDTNPALAVVDRSEVVAVIQCININYNVG